MMPLLLVLSGCILGPRPDSCDANADCRDAFGFGNVCGAEGYCEPVELIARCDSTYPEDLFDRPENYPDVLVLGSIFNVPFDEKQQLSVELAIRNIRDAERQGGPYQRPVAIVHCDNADDIAYDNLTTVDAAAASATFLVEELGVQAIIGPSTSDESFAVFDAASVGGAITISPSATSPTLTDLGGLPSGNDPGLFWRTAPPDDLQAAVIAQDLSDRGVGSVVIYHQVSSYATSLAEAVDEQFSALGGDTTVISYDSDFAFTDKLVQVFNDPSEEIVFFTSETSQVVEFLDQAATAGQTGRPIFLADAAADSALFDVASGADILPFVRGTRPQVPTGLRIESFALNYNGAYSDTPLDSVFTSYSFDAAWLALYGAMWADVNGEQVTGTTIGQGILQLSEGTVYDIGYSSVGGIRTAFEEGASVNVEGVSGNLDYDPVTGEVSNPIEVWVVDLVAEDFDPVKLCEPGGGCTDLSETTTGKK